MKFVYIIVGLSSEQPLFLFHSMPFILLSRVSPLSVLRTGNVEICGEQVTRMPGNVLLYCVATSCRTAVTAVFYLHKISVLISFRCS